jgi:hypothetical protein
MRKEEKRERTKEEHGKWKKEMAEGCLLCNTSKFNVTTCNDALILTL